MFVLKLCGWYPSRTDVLSGDFVQRQAVAIATQIKTVVLFAIKDPVMQGRQIELKKRVSGNLYEYIFYYPQKQFADKFFSQWYYLRILKMFLKLMLEEHGEPTLVHVNIVWRAAIWALMLHKRYSWPFVVTENSTEYQDNAAENIRNKSFLRRKITRNTFQKCSHFIPVSSQLGEKICDLYGNVPYSVVPNTVDTSIFYLEKELPKAAVIRFLHVSTMGYQKNFEGLVRTLGSLAQADLPFEVVFVGPATGEAAEMVTKNANLHGKFRFTGPIAYEEVANEMRAADCLVLFSRYENLPCVILEALCCGVPVISTNVGGVPEIINHSNGILVDDGDEQALFDSMTSIALKKINFDHEAIAASASALYNYQTVGRSFIALYQNLYPGIW